MRAMVLALALLSWGFIEDEKPKPQAAEEAATEEAATEVDEPPVAMPDLLKELLERVERDQEYRNKIVAFINEHGKNGAFSEADLSEELQKEFFDMLQIGGKIDAENTEWLKGVVKEHGFPTISMVGKKGANAAWLLVQHADNDKPFQRECLDLMTALPKEEVLLSNLAYLTDRVLVGEGKKQLYGTQFHTVEGKLVPQPIEDEEHVDERRKEMGLGTLEEYRKQIESVYSGKKEEEKATDDEEKP